MTIQKLQYQLELKKLKRQETQLQTIKEDTEKTFVELIMKLERNRIKQREIEDLTVDADTT